MREGTKQALVIEMLRRPRERPSRKSSKPQPGLSHTTRGFMAGALKKKLGLTIDSEKDETRGRIYRVSLTTRPKQMSHQSGNWWLLSSQGCWVVYQP